MKHSRSEHAPNKSARVKTERMKQNRFFRWSLPALTLSIAAFAGDLNRNALAQEADITESDPIKAAALEGKFISKIRQLTLEGKRAGEGYYSADGKRMVFQSERDPANPFFQIYVMDFETGDVEQASPGSGKTTCAWLHPSENRVLFASTHDDPKAEEKQKAELELRASGKERRYSWDYDETYEIYDMDIGSKERVNLTKTVGYDAEGSWSPDGKTIVFASNRRAYSEQLSDEEKKLFEIDPASQVDIYMMKADGSEVKRLTDTLGYDGGPFFSPDGKKICWRRFSEDGATAEIMVMNSDGTDQRAVTRIGAMSWAPYFHPSGDYLIFTTNKHGFANFELYLVAAEGASEPVRVTHSAGFDGLPVFSPDGKQLSWTTNRTAAKQSQIFVADWNHEFAKQIVSTSSPAGEEKSAATDSAIATSKEASVAFTAADVGRHVDYLCRPELGGRGTGTQGEKLATAYVAAYLDQLGLKPAGPDGSWYQEFEFTSGVNLGSGNKLAAGEKSFEMNKDWRPVGFSKGGKIEPSGVVFAGYGIVAPKGEKQEEYDSFVHLDVKDKWVVVFRYMPENISPEKRQQFSTHSSLRYKAMTVRDRGARGLIIVSGPNAVVKDELVPLSRDGQASGTSVGVISVSNEVAESWLKMADKSLKDLQDKLDGGEPMMGFEIPGLTLESNIEIVHEKGKGRNVLGRLQFGDEPSKEVLMVGAHVDHLGTGPSSDSLAKDDEKSGVHFGADDNASGVAGLLEIAEYLSAQKKEGKLKGTRDIVFAGWSGEELGLLGSAYFVKELQEKAIASHGKIHPEIAAYVNLDMIGRLREKLVLQGIGSSPIWLKEIEKRNAGLGLALTLQNDGDIPTDGAVFYRAGVPMLAAFTGSHDEYHTPRDTPETLNFEGAAKVAQLLGLIVRGLATQAEAPTYVQPEKSPSNQPRAALRAYLGSIPDYAQEDVKGVLLSGTSKNSPAAKAGIQAGDIVVELAGKKIENIYDYTFAIEALKIGQPTKMVIMRKGERKEFEVTPGSRE